jgi:hypothetical protein
VDAFDCRGGLGGNPQAFFANGRIAQVGIGVGKPVFHDWIISADGGGRGMNGTADQVAQLEFLTRLQRILGERAPADEA